MLGEKAAITYILTFHYWIFFSLFEGLINYVSLFEDFGRLNRRHQVIHYWKFWAKQIRYKYCGSALWKYHITLLHFGTAIPHKLWKIIDYFPSFHICFSRYFFRLFNRDMLTENALTHLEHSNIYSMFYEVKKIQNNARLIKLVKKIVESVRFR